jgi:hypothetical protein
VFDTTSLHAEERLASVIPFLNNVPKTRIGLRIQNSIPKPRIALQIGKY